jgi:hypothetical protein
VLRQYKIKQKNKDNQSSVISRFLMKCSMWKFESKLLISQRNQTGIDRCDCPNG